MLAKLYHAHHCHYREDIPFWMRLVEGVESVLELGCGSGRVSIPLARGGSYVWGMDRDEAMLEVARANLAREPEPVRERISLFRADMAQFQLATRFGTAICPCNTFSVLTARERKAVWQRVTEHLKPQGVFAISLPNPTLLAQFKDQTETESTQEAIFSHPETGNPVQVSSAIESVEEGVIWRWHYDHLLPDGQVERLTMSTKHYYTPLEVYEREMREIGFHLRGLYGDFEKGQYTSESLYLILEAQKIA